MIFFNVKVILRMFNKTRLTKLLSIKTILNGNNAMMHSCQKKSKMQQYVYLKCALGFLMQVSEAYLSTIYFFASA